MFQQHFLNYLVERDRLTHGQHALVRKQQQTVRVKLGLIAVAEGLLTKEQAEKLNALQMQTDQRFGDLAIEQGYLTTEQLDYLLGKQGNPYMQMVQILSENQILDPQQVSEQLSLYGQENGFSQAELEVLKAGQLDAIIPLFVKTDNPLADRYLGLAVRNIIRFINNQPLVMQAKAVTDYSADYLAYQELEGDHALWLGFAGKEKGLLQIAAPFAQEDFKVVDEDAFDAVCEFTNCINGLFATELSEQGVELEILPPHFGREKMLKTAARMYLAPLVLNGEKIDLVAVVDGQVEIN